LQQPVLALLLVGLLAALLGLPWLSIAPNRLVSGQGLALTRALDGASSGLLLPLLLVAILLP
jgi:osmoprotectant transport system permease protein